MSVPYILSRSAETPSEGALAESQRRLEGIIVSAMDAIISIDSDHRIVLFNPAAEKMFGVSAEEVMGQDLGRFIPARFRAEHPRYVRHFGVTGVTTRHMGALSAVRGLRANGEEFPVEASISQVDIGGGDKLFTVILRDITERQRAEEQLRFLAAIVESSEDAIIGETLDGIIISWNQGAEKIYGYTAAEIIGKPISMLAAPERRDEIPLILDQLKRGEHIKAYETLRRRKNGEIFHVSLSVSPIKNAAGEIVGASAIARDISRRKRAEAGLQRAQAELEAYAKNLEKTVTERTDKLVQVNGELEAFCYSLSHDMRAPLRAIEGMTQLVLHQARDRLEPHHTAMLGKAIAASQRLDRLIQDVLAFSRLSRHEIVIGPVDLERLAREIIHETPAFQPPLADIVIEGELLPVIGNETYLTQVITNLLNNSVKFVAHGVKPCIHLRTEVVASQPSTLNAQLIRLWVADNGIGIPRDLQGKVFELFERGHRQTEYEGTGLGLAIVRKAVEKLGGAVGLESEPGQGTRFWVQLRGVSDSTKPPAEPRLGGDASPCR